MDIPQLCAVLAACVGVDVEARKAAEQALNQHRHARGHIVNLLRVALEDTLDPAIRQVAAISFKNTAKRDWEGEDKAPSPLAEEDKAAVRELIVEGVVRAPHAVRVQLGESVRSIIYCDYPDKWPQLLQQIYALLTSQDEQRIGGALYVLRLLARKYEFRDEEDRVPLQTIVNTTFPVLLPIFKHLLATDSPSPDLAQLLKLVCKIFWSTTYMDIPALLVQEEQFVGWMGGLHALMLKPVPLEHMPADPDARLAWPWWKAKKWVMHIAYRLFNRYGDPGLCKEPNDVAFAARFQKECSLTFLGAAMQMMAGLAQGAYMSPRVVNLLLQYVTQALAYSHTWKELKPHIEQMLLSVVFPLLCFNAEDEALWRDDPQEYVRKGYDIMEDMYSTKTAAMNFVHELCKARAKHCLDMLMNHLVGVLGEYKSAPHPGPSPDLARKMDGALLAIGTLADVLKEKKRYKSQLEPMLLQHIVPLFSSPYGHLRAKACWLAGTYADIEFSDGQGRGATFTALLQRVVQAISDHDLPVRIDASVAVRSFLDAVEAEDLDALRPLVPELLKQFLQLSQEVDNEDLTFSLETVVERFSSDMAPYAVGLCSHLTQQFWRIVASEGGDDDDDDEGALAAYGVLRALSTVLESVCSLPELYPQLEDILFPLLQRYTSTEGQDIFEEIMQIVTYLTYFAPAISPRMWTLYPLMLQCVNEWAIDYLENVLLPLDNFISKGGEVFVTCQEPNYLAMTNQTLERVLTGDGYPEDQVVCAPRLMGVILQHLKGRVDHCVGPYLSLVLRRLGGEVGDADLADALMLVPADALYYNPALTLQQLSQQGALQHFFAALSTAIGKQKKSGKMKHFTAPRDKKILLLGLISLLSCPEQQMPQEIKAGLQQVLGATMRVLLALKQQQEELERGEGSEDDSSKSGNESDSEGESGESDLDDSDDDGDDLDEAYMRRLQRAAAKRAGYAERDDYDESDEEWWTDEEEEVSSPIDAVDPFIYFAETLHALQHSEPSKFAALSAAMDAGTQAAVQGMMAYAQQVKQELLLKAQQEQQQAVASGQQ